MKQMKETNETGMTLDTGSPQGMDILIQFISTQQTRIPKRLLKDMVEAADFLQINDL